MREHAVIVPTSVGPAAGVVTEPAGPQRGALVILQGLGVPCRAGVNANWTRLARKLTELGLVVLRFDFSCDGDSTLAGREVERDIGWKRSTDLGMLRDIAPWFLQRCGEPGLFLVGSCHGGRIALEYAASDPAALGLFLVTPYLWRREPLEDGDPDPDLVRANGPTLDTDAQIVAGLRTVLSRAPVQVLVGEGEAGDVLPFSRRLERSGQTFELDIVPGVPIHPVGHPEQQERVWRWLPERLAAAVAEREPAGPGPL